MKSDRLYYAQNEISDVDENSILSHGTTCPPETNGQFPYAMDCRQFLNCWNGRGTIQSCAPGTLFNPRSLECDHPSKVKCKSFDEFAKPSYTAQYTREEKEVPTYGQPLPSSTTWSSSGQQGQQRRVQCHSDAIGLYAHPSDCTKFLNCNHGQTVIQDCGPGTAFNSITKVCDWPQNVDCGSRALSPDGSIEGSDDHTEIHHGEGMIDQRFSGQQQPGGAGAYHQSGYRAPGNPSLD